LTECLGHVRVATLAQPAPKPLVIVSVSQVATLGAHRYDLERESPAQLGVRADILGNREAPPRTSQFFDRLAVAFLSHRITVLAKCIIKNRRE